MSTVTHSVPILDLSCGGGGALSLEHALEEMDGVVTVWVNPATETAYVTLDPERILMRDVVWAIEEYGHAAGVYNSLPGSASRDPGGRCVEG